jgi:hypothetical protein
MSQSMLDTILSHRFLLLSIVPVVVVFILLVAANLIRERPFALRTFMVGSDMLLGTVGALAVQIITGYYMMQLGNVEHFQMRRVPYHLFGSLASLVAVLPLLAICLTLERRVSEHRIQRRATALFTDIIAGALPLISAGYIAAVRSM